MAISVCALSVVMDYAEQGDLLTKVLDYQKKGVFLSEKEIWSIFIQVSLNRILLASWLKIGGQRAEVFA